MRRRVKAGRVGWISKNERLRQTRRKCNRGLQEGLLLNRRCDHTAPAASECPIGHLPFRTDRPAKGEQSRPIGQAPQPYLAPLLEKQFWQVLDA